MNWKNHKFEFFRVLPYPMYIKQVHVSNFLDISHLIGKSFTLILLPIKTYLICAIEMALVVFLLFNGYKARAWGPRRPQEFFCVIFSMGSYEG